MILATAITIGLSTLFLFKTVESTFSPDIKAIIILVVLLAIHFAYKMISKKKPSPILMILISAVMGILLYS